MATGETLSFEAKRNQSGKYWCLAESGLNPTANASAYLDVQCECEMYIYFVRVSLFHNYSYFLKVELTMTLVQLNSANKTPRGKEK